MSRPRRALQRATSRATATDMHDAERVVDRLRRARGCSVGVDVVAELLEQARGRARPRRRSRGATASPSRRARAEPDAQPAGGRADLVAVRPRGRRRGVRDRRVPAPATASSTAAVSRTDPRQHELVRQRAPVLAEVGPSVVRARVGLSPTMPHMRAGKRIEPPMSLPCATGTSPAATAAAEPPLDPPGAPRDDPTDCASRRTRAVRS